MQLTLRPYVTTGVALVGASVIAVTPISAPPPVHDVQVHAVQLSAAVQSIEPQNPLNALVSTSMLASATSVTEPIEAWVRLVTTTIGNLGTLGQQVAANPAPILRQVIANQLGYLQTIATSVQGFTTAVAAYLTTNVPAGLETAAAQLRAGDINGAAETILITVNGIILGPGFQLMPLLSIPGTMANNFAKAVSYVSGVGLWWPLLGAITGPFYGAFTAAAASVQDIADAIGAGDPVGALGALVGMPAETVNAFINGFSYYRGLLTQHPFYGKGLIPTLLVSIPQAIAAAIANPGTQGLLSGLSTTAETPAESSTPESTELATPHSNTSPASIPEALTAALTALPTRTVTLTPDASTITDADVTETTPATPEEETVKEPTEADATDADPEIAPEVKPVSNSGTSNGATDLSGGNKVTPGQTHSNTKGSDSNGADTDVDPPESPADDESAPSGADSGAAAGGSEGPGSAAGGSNDGSDSGSDS